MLNSVTIVYGEFQRDVRKYVHCAQRAYATPSCTDDNLCRLVVVFGGQISEVLVLDSKVSVMVLGTQILDHDLVLKKGYF